MNPAEAVESPIHKHLSSSHTLQIVKIPLDLKPLGFERQIAYTLENVLTPEECQKLIEHTEQLGYGPALIHTGNRLMDSENKAVLVKDVRDSERLMIDDKEFSSILMQRIRKHLPPDYKFPCGGNKHVNYKLLEINERFRFLKYGPGGIFKPHYDGQYERPDGSAMTWVTLQIYLNEGMEGGETTFLAEVEPQEQSKPENRIQVKPKTGMILVFHHNIFHEGSKVTRGLKYTIRSDVLYEEGEVMAEEAAETNVQNKRHKSCSIA